MDKDAKELKKPEALAKTGKAAAERRTPASEKRGAKAKSILRLAGQEVDGSLTLLRALEKVRGIGHNLAAVLSTGIEEKLGIQPSAVIGDLSEEQLSKVEEAIAKPIEYNVPSFLLNRPADVEEGTSKHFVGTPLALAVKRDIDRHKNMRTWIGWRHSLGQKVRGQHTRTSGRTGITVGVLRKVVKEALKAKAAEEKK